MSYWNEFYDFFPRSKPKAAKGGIKAQSKRGDFGKSWWAKRWIAVLERFNIGERLSRGRSYARRGQVTEIHIDSGVVKAKVQGSRPSPYKVTIKVKTLSKMDAENLAKVLSRQALFAAKLLAGEMPQNIEEAFESAGISLFPERYNDLETDCSCPDWSNPCKHIAAVYYLLGEEFDRDPFLIFKLRGLDSTALAEMIGQDAKEAEIENVSEQKAPPEPLPVDLEQFWGTQDVLMNFDQDVTIPNVPASLPKRLGHFPFWRSEQNFMEVMENVYRRASQHAMDVFLSTRPGFQDPIKERKP